MDTTINHKISDALWRLYRRPERPTAWTNGGNLPWNDPDFSRRMLREHLDESHGAASRRGPERAQQIEWLRQRLALKPDMHLLDFTCGPGLYAAELARQGCTVMGVDFGPASIAYARELATQEGVAERCTFVEEDVRAVPLPNAAFDAALFLYGQLGVFSREDAKQLLEKLARCLKPGARLAIELLNQETVDKTPHSTWWYTDGTGLWGDAPFLHLGERFWDNEAHMAMERFYTVHLETGQLDEIHLCDQTYAVDEMRALLRECGFAQVDVYPAWDGLDIYDAREWNVYVAER